MNRRSATILGICVMGHFFSFVAQAWPDRVDADLAEIPEKIRVIQDIGRLCAALENPRRRNIVPAIVQVDQFNQQGWIVEGTITLLNPADLSVSIRHPLNVRWKMITSGRGYEEDRKFSPYYTPSPPRKVVISALPEEPHTVTEFPETYMVPEAWFADVVTVAAIKGDLTPAELPADAAISAALRGFILLQRKEKVAELAEVLKQGDEYSQAYTLCRLFMSNDASAIPVLVDCIEKATSAPRMQALALGLATACGYYRLEPNDFPRTVKALYRFAEMNPNEAGEIRKFLKWYRSEWGR